jgi:hypothetical protein
MMVLTTTPAKQCFSVSDDYKPRGMECDKADTIFLCRLFLISMELGYAVDEHQNKLRCDL